MLFSRRTLDNDDFHSPNRTASRLPLILALVALAGVAVLFVLYLGQRSANRELRAMVLNERANSALNAGAGAEAEMLLAEVAALNPDTPALWRRRAVARMMSNQPFEAIAAAREHLLENPGDVNIATLLGAAQILTQDYEGADQTLNSALQLAPLNRDLVQNLSELRRLQKRPAEAARLINMYLAQNPDDGFFQFKRAMADVAGELTDEQRSEFAKAMEADDATAGIYVVGAAIDFRDGNPDAAREKIEAAAMRSSPQDLQTMLQDEFFRDHLQFTPQGAPPAP